MVTFGFKFELDSDSAANSISFNKWSSIEFEFLASILLGTLFSYYND